MYLSMQKPIHTCMSCPVIIMMSLVFQARRSSDYVPVPTPTSTEQPHHTTSSDPADPEKSVADLRHLQDNSIHQEFVLLILA